MWWHAGHSQTQARGPQTLSGLAPTLAFIWHHYGLDHMNKTGRTKFAWRRCQCESGASVPKGLGESLRQLRVTKYNKQQVH